MILKNYNLNHKILENYKIFLFYGNNEGYKQELINNFFLSKNQKVEKVKLEENEIISNENIFYEEINNNNLFNEKKLIIISRASDKLTKIIKNIFEDKNNEDIKILIKSGDLAKNSSLRKLFEKEKILACVPFYEDNERTLYSKIEFFLKNKEVKLSREGINILINRCRGDRGNLEIELKKIENLSATNKKISSEDLLKLTNLAENYSIFDLSDAYLSKNLSRSSKILNENNFSDEDCIALIRAISNRSKRLLKLMQDYKDTKNIETTVERFKPPIFWKEKESIKKQILSWTEGEINRTIYECNDIEMLIKKNSSSALNLVSDFVYNY